MDDVLAECLKEGPRITMYDEGVIKYHCTWDETPPQAGWNGAALNSCRNWLYGNGLIGVTADGITADGITADGITADGMIADGIGYGNISQRYRHNEFIITGSATGHLAELTDQHYCLVTSFDPSANHLSCIGPIKASSESMSHGVLYRLCGSIGAVIHVHHRGMWDFFLDKAPTTSSDVPYGTPEMAFEIERLYRETTLPHTRFMVMGGHCEGIITFGRSIEDALSVVKKHHARCTGLPQQRSAGVITPHDAINRGRASGSSR